VWLEQLGESTEASATGTEPVSATDTER